jgi:glycosyltransferase involved in cell wall biosynthesis
MGPSKDVAIQSPGARRTAGIARLMARELPGMETLRMPTISVLMPVYNAAGYLSEAVESILGQTFADFEFLIVDDGSTDRSPAILERYAARDRRIRLTSRPNTGHTVALNELLGVAGGELLARMDADDIALPTRLARQVDYLRAHPDVVCVGTAVHFIDSAGRFLRARHPGMDHEEIQERALAGDCPLNHPSVMMRRAAVEAVGGYRAEFQPAEDLDLWLRLGEVGRLTSLPEVLMKYRQHTGSFSERYQRLQRERSAVAVLEACRRRGIPPRDVALSPWRPVDRRSRMQTYIGYGSRGLDRSDYRMAFHYSLQAIRQIPWRLGGWQLLARVLRRRLVRALRKRPQAPAADVKP